MFRGSRCCGSADAPGLSRKPPAGRGDGRRRLLAARLICRYPLNWVDGRRTNAGCEIASRSWLAIARRVCLALRPVADWRFGGWVKRWYIHQVFFLLCAGTLSYSDLCQFVLPVVI